MKRFFWYTLNLQLFADGTAQTDSMETGDNIADAEQTNTENSSDEFSQLINGKFKDEFTKKTQGIINQRFKQTKELEAYKGKVSPTIDALMKKYGLNQGEEDKLIDCIDSENEQTKQPQTSNQNTLKSKIASWLKEGEAMKQKNPDFDLRGEIKNNKLSLVFCRNNF